MKRGMINPYDLDIDLQEKISKIFWTSKWGHLPTKIEPVVRKMSLEEHRRETEKEFKEYTEFVNQYLNDSVFRAKFE